MKKTIDFKSKDLKNKLDDLDDGFEDDFEELDSEFQAEPIAKKTIDLKSASEDAPSPEDDPEEEFEFDDEDAASSESNVIDFNDKQAARNDSQPSPAEESLLDAAADDSSSFNDPDPTLSQMAGVHESLGDLNTMKEKAEAEKKKLEDEQLMNENANQQPVQKITLAAAFAHGAGQIAKGVKSVSVLTSDKVRDLIANSALKSNVFDAKESADYVKKHSENVEKHWSGFNKKLDEVRESLGHKGNLPSRADVLKAMNRPMSENGSLPEIKELREVFKDHMKEGSESRRASDEYSRYFNSYLNSIDTSSSIALKQGDHEAMKEISEVNDNLHRFIKDNKTPAINSDGDAVPTDDKMKEVVENIMNSISNMMSSLSNMKPSA